LSQKKKDAVEIPRQKEKEGILEKLTFDQALDLFKKFIEAVTGKKDIQSRLAVLSNPENLKTMSILRRNEADFVIESYWASEVPEWGGMFKGLRKLADEKLETSISIEGKGRDQTISLAGAFTESKLGKMIGLSLQGEGKEKS